MSSPRSPPTKKAGFGIAPKELVDCALERLVSVLLLFDCYVAVFCSGLLRNVRFGRGSCCIPSQQSLSEVEATLIMSQYMIAILHQINGFLHIGTLLGSILASKDIPDEALVSFTQQMRRLDASSHMSFVRVMY
jgi:hypothetical protein